MCPLWTASLQVVYKPGDNVFARAVLLMAHICLVIVGFAASYFVQHLMRTLLEGKGRSVFDLLTVPPLLHFSYFARNMQVVYRPGDTVFARAVLLNVLDRSAASGYQWIER